MPTSDTPEHIVVLTALGADRPGIVAALTGAVLALGGNLSDTTMTRLHGVFATMLAVRLPQSVTLSDIDAALRPVAAETGVTVSVQPAPDAPAPAPPDSLLTVYGADRPGIVHTVTARLAARGVNITDMDTRRVGTPDTPVYVCLLEASVGDIDLTADMDTLRAELGAQVNLQPLDTDAL